MHAIDIRPPEWLPAAPQIDLQAGYIQDSNLQPRLYSPHGVSREYQPPIHPQTAQTMCLFGTVTVVSSLSAGLLSTLTPFMAALTGAALTAFGFYLIKEAPHRATDADKLKLLNKLNQPRRHKAITELFRHISPLDNKLTVKVVGPRTDGSAGGGARSAWSGWYDAKSNTIKVSNDIPLDLLHNALHFLWACASQRGRLQAIHDNREGSPVEKSAAENIVVGEIQRVADRLETSFFRCYGYNDTLDVMGQSDYGRFFRFGASCGKNNVLTFDATLWPVPAKERSINIPREFIV